MKPLTRFFKNKHVQRILRVSIASIIAVGISLLDLSYLDAWAYDIRVRLSPVQPTSGHLKIIEITPNDVEFLKGKPFISDFTSLLLELKKAQPKAILFLNDMEQVTGSLRDKQKLAAVAQSFNHIYFSINQLIIKGEEKNFQLPEPLDKVPVEMSLLTADDTNFSKDNVTRRVILENAGIPFIHNKLAQLFNGLHSAQDYKGSFQYLTSTQALINFRPKGTYKTSSFLTIMNGAFDPKDFKDKIILIGDNTLTNTEDYRLTPFSREPTAMTNLEVQANMMDTLIQNSAPTKAPAWLNLLVTILISIITVFSVFTLRPSRGLLVLFSTLCSYLLISYIAFAFFGFVTAITHPLLSIFICYYFFIPYRLIMENRLSWEYYQHNKMLSEVEELKTNFLRMMSHDLKTPLARIQGMTDVALRDASNLTELQAQAMGNIRKSSAELTSFIESILNLSRIESQKVNLQLQSKDINDILEKVVEKCQFLAQAKSITLITEFEPLFSIKLDVGLMTQVFTNLVENAIKYSPDHSKVLISTEEVNGTILVQIADQGFGIAKNDLTNVFDKFYRSQSDKTVGVKGSGLGLFLSKYFVNLHKGDITVESELTQGSTFTVQLPMKPESRGDRYV